MLGSRLTIRTAFCESIVALARVILKHARVLQSPRGDSAARGNDSAGKRRLTTSARGGNLI